LEKNNDALHASLEFLIQDSKNPLLQKLFAGEGMSKAGKLNFISVGSKFRKQLDVLMDKLRSTVSS
jgi:myosin-6